MFHYASLPGDTSTTRKHAKILFRMYFLLFGKKGKLSFLTLQVKLPLTCVKNLSLNYLRSQGYKQEYETTIKKNIPIYFNNLDDLYTLQELQHLLYQTLEKLPPEYRLAFELNRLENKSIEEIAEIMGVSCRTVKRYKSKAIEILKKELKDYLPLFMLFTSIFDK